MDNDVTIILGESDKGHAILTEQNLKGWGLGCTVIRFEDGKGIIDFLTIMRDADFLFDRQYVVLMSFSMLRMDGLEVLKAMNQARALKDIPVIILTAIKDEKTIADCLDAGCDAVLKKPVEKEAFSRVLNNIGVITMSPSIS